MKRDIIITWPKTRTLDSYLNACVGAKIRGEVINFRIANPPNFEFGAHKDRDGRVYVVHDGFVRGYQELIHVAYREANEVLDPVTGGFWPEGWYLVRNPEWHEINPIPMKGFQGFRYFNEVE